MENSRFDFAIEMREWEKVKGGEGVCGTQVGGDGRDWYGEWE